MTNFTGNPIEANTLYHCRLNPRAGGNRILANVLYVHDQGALKPLLYSDAIDEETGAIVANVELPPAEINPCVYIIDILEKTQYQGTCFNSSKDLFKSLGINKHIVWESIGCRLIEPTPPPKGPTKFVTTLEDSRGQRELRQYTLSKRYQLIDTVTKAVVEMEEQDILAYLQPQ